MSMDAAGYSHALPIDNQQPSAFKGMSTHLC